VSALAYALLLSNIEPAGLFVPVINIRRKRFNLRTEASFLFKKRKIPTDLLVFRDEIDLEGLHREGKLRVFLVDHNLLDPSDAFLEEDVVGVIDHHLDSGLFLHCETRIIRQVGSCTSLVTKEILDTCPTILDRDLSRILLAPIVLDTADLDHSLARPEMSFDEAIAAQLLDLIQPRKYSKIHYRSRYFQKLIKAKHDIGDISGSDLLRRDYKEWEAGGLRYGISTITSSFSTWSDDKGSPVDLFFERMKDKSLDLLVVMLVSFGSNLSRELAILTHNQKLGSYVVNAFYNSPLKLTCLQAETPDIFEPPEARSHEDMEGSLLGGICSLPDFLGQPEPGSVFYVFSQKNVSLSRKSIQPLLHSTLSQIGWAE